MNKKGITRRIFMKSGLSWVAGTFAGLGSFPKAASDRKIRAVSRTSLKSLQAIPTTCQQCPAGCGIISYLDGEKLVQILGNPHHPNNQGGICAKGIAGINLVNDPERLLHPLKRAGVRGSGTWTRISWDEVYSTLRTRIRRLLDTDRISEFVIDKGQDDSLFDLFLHSLGRPRVINRTAIKNMNRNAALSAMVGSGFLLEDIGRSRTVFNFGANPFANHDHFIGFARRLVQARTEKGARLVTFDVRMSETAAKSDTWHPLRAGTDGIVALAMARVIMAQGLADSDFIQKRTDLTLTGMKRLLSPYTLELAEQESGIKSSDIERMAVDFATQKPSIAIFGGGIIDHKNGTQNARCVSLLNWLVGNLEKEGGLFFSRPARGQKDAEKNIPSSLSDPRIPIKRIGELREDKIPVDTMFLYLSNPAYSEPDCQSAARFLKDERKVPFLVAMDTHLTETAILADIVLPSATFLEGWGLDCLSSLDGDPILNFRQPVVSLMSVAKALRSPDFDVGKLLEPLFLPMGEAVEIGNVCLELARRIGGEISKKFPFKDTREFVLKAISSIHGPGAQKVLAVLKEKGFWIDTAVDKNSGITADAAKGLSKTPAVKIRSEHLEQKSGSLLPGYQAIQSHALIKKNEFILTTFKSNLMGKGTANSKWAREILHENRLWINPGAAREIGIRKGDRVEITSPRGSLTARVLITGRIHPESVALAEGLGHKAVGKVTKAKRFKSKDRDTALIWWDQKGNGVNPMEIVEAEEDPTGGGLGLKDTVVRIEKKK